MSKGAQKQGQGCQKGLKRRELGVKACPTGRKLPQKGPNGLKPKKRGRKKALFPQPRLCAVGRVAHRAIFQAQNGIFSLGAKLALLGAKWHF